MQPWQNPEQRQMTKKFHSARTTQFITLTCTIRLRGAEKRSMAKSSFGENGMVRGRRLLEKDVSDGDFIPGEGDSDGDDNDDEEEQYIKILNKKYIAELKELLKDKGLKSAGNKAILIQRLVDAKYPRRKISTATQSPTKTQKKSDFADMKMDELRAALKDKGLPQRGNKADLISRLQNGKKRKRSGKPSDKHLPRKKRKLLDKSTLNQWSVVELRTELSSRGKRKSGLKAELIDRLLEDKEEECEENKKASVTELSPDLSKPALRKLAREYGISTKGSTQELRDRIIAYKKSNDTSSSSGDDSDSSDDSDSDSSSSSSTEVSGGSESSSEDEGKETKQKTDEDSDSETEPSGDWRSQIKQLLDIEKSQMAHRKAIKKRKKEKKTKNKKKEKQET
eukprot:TRINITY_DN4598_c0_g1_i2.p1 TRINITY_DN4598_c0_g1~~TRINITY_DN4598_c0_g1_i2.p1  ORF type:complete len:395 (-),score=106.42 TRINITY_DN4598_c0_g1_i2:11-1195(-)